MLKIKRKISPSLPIHLPEYIHFFITFHQLLMIAKCLSVHMLQDFLDFNECVIRQPGYEFLSLSRPHFHITLRQLWFEYHSSQFTTPAFRSRIGGWGLSVGGTQNMEMENQVWQFFTLRKFRHFTCLFKWLINKDNSMKSLFSYYCFLFDKRLLNIRFYKKYKIFQSVYISSCFHCVFAKVHIILGAAHQSQPESNSPELNICFISETTRELHVEPTHYPHA